MIAKRIQPAPGIAHFIREYVLFHAVFDAASHIPPKSYPVIPEEGIIFLLRGSLHAESPEFGTTRRRPEVFIFGLPGTRQNLFISNEYMMFCVRFQPGALFKLLRIPMMELVHNYLDASLVLGHEIKRVQEQLMHARDYGELPVILDRYLESKILSLKSNDHPVDIIGEMILNDPENFNLDRTAQQACLSHRQFERIFVKQIGVTPKYFSRICRFHKAYELKEYQPGLDWLSVAVRSGYSDYQHLAKDFKQFAGDTPKSFLAECEQNPERMLDIETDFRGA